MAYIPNLQATCGLLRSRENHPSRSSWNRPQCQPLTAERETWRTIWSYDLLASEKGDKNIRRASGSFPDDCETDAAGVGKAF